jgi:hypothetical protein
MRHAVPAPLSLGAMRRRPCCVADDRSAWTAYAVISGIAPSALAGTVLLVDQQGWLRARWRSDDPSSWFDPMDLSAKIEEIRNHPIERNPGGGHAAQH